MSKLLNNFTPQQLVALTGVLLVVGQGNLQAQQSVTLTVTTSPIVVTGVTPTASQNLNIVQDVTLNNPPITLPTVSPITITPVAITATTFCPSLPATAIIRDCTLGTSTFEANMVATWLAQHGLPQSDAALIYKYGNEDLRDVLRAYMFDFIKGAIREDPGKRNANPDALAVYNWIQEAVRQREIALYRAAVGEYHRFTSSPCKFTLDPTVASAFGLTFDNIPWCFSSTQSLYGEPKSPKSDYYMDYGQTVAYDQAVSSHPGDVKIKYETQALAPEWHYLIALGPAALLAASASGAIALNITTVAPFAQRQFLDTNATTEAAQSSGVEEASLEETTAEVTSEVTEEAASDAVETVAESAALEGSALADVLGVFAIVLVAIEIAVVAGLALKDDLDNQAAIDAMVSYDATQVPDLVTMIQDTSVGYNKIYETFLAATLPDTRAPQALPQPDPAGRFFVTNAANQTSAATSFSYMSWDPADKTYNVPLTASIYGGWLLETGTTSGSPAAPIAQFTTKIHYTDPSTNTKMLADRQAGGLFLVHKDTSAIATTDVDCPADASGKTPTPIASSCKDFVTDTLHLTSGTGAAISVRLPQAPVFFGPKMWFFPIGFTGNFAVQVDGRSQGLPCTLATSDALPPGLSLSSTGITGKATGNPSSYIVNLTATCAELSSSETVTLQTYAPTLAFTWPTATSPQITMTQGRFSQFTIMTSGQTHAILPGANALPIGMTMSYLGGNTATVSGFPSGRPNCGSSCDSAITAFDPFGGSVSTTLNYTLIPPVLPTPPPTQTITWYQGQSNTFFFDGSVANVKLLWNVTSGQLPSWASFQMGGGPSYDLSNNTATVTATPPLNSPSSISFSYTFTPQGNPTSQPFNLRVNIKPPIPILTVTKPLLFSPGGATCFSGLINPTCQEGIIKSGTQTGVTLAGIWRLLGPLPSGLTSQVSGDRTTMTISGSAGPNTAGNYKIPIQFTDQAGVSTTQSINVMIVEPADLSGFPSRIVLWSGMPANWTLPATKGFPRLAANSPGDGLPSTIGTGVLIEDPSCGPSCGAALAAANNGINFGFLPLGNAYITGTPRNTAIYNLRVFAQTFLKDTSAPVGKSALANTTVYVAIPGDANLDGTVDCSDYSLVKGAYGSARGGPTYTDLADVNHDGLVNVLDLSFVQSHLPKGTVCH